MTGDTQRRDRAAWLRLIPLLAGLAGCVPPGFDGDPLRPDDSPQPVPDIAPLTPLLAQARDLPDSTDPDPELRLRGEALQRSAASQPPADSSDLAERGAELRRRADEIRAADAP